MLNCYATEVYEKVDIRNCNGEGNKNMNVTRGVCLMSAGGKEGMGIEIFVNKRKEFE